MSIEIIGKTVAAVEVQEWAGKDAFKDDVTWERTVITFTDETTIAFDSWDGEVYDPYRCVFDDDGLPHELVETDRTCKHCGRAIGYSKEEGWIDPEAGYDDENGDGMWRTTCDCHDTFVAEHEPGDYVLHYTSADDGGSDATWSVYREVYPDRDSDTPIDGSQIRVSTWPSEKAADDEANRLQAEYLKSIA